VNSRVVSPSFQDTLHRAIGRFDVDSQGMQPKERVHVEPGKRPDGLSFSLLLYQSYQVAKVDATDM
jgi:hypothetical protein